MARRLLLALPAMAALVVLWAVLTAGAPRPVAAVQVLGGPTRGIRQLSLLLRAVTSDGSQLQPVGELELRVSAQSSALHAEWQGQTNQSGYAEARLDFGRLLEHDPVLRVVSAATGQVLAEGELSLLAGDWRSGARRQGGWLPGQAQGDLHLSVAPSRGALAVPFPAEIVVKVEPAADPAASRNGILVELELEGARVLSPDRRRTSLTDSTGLARFWLAPAEHAVIARVRATDQAGQSGQWYGALPIVAGALHAALYAGELAVSSPIPRDEAFVSIVSETERLAGAIVALTADGDGASGKLALEPGLVALLSSAPSWAVVSSEYDKRSPAVVGWPLAPAPRDPFEPPLTFDVADRLLHDGLPIALATERQERTSRRRTAVALLAVIGVAMSGLLGYELLRKRAARAGAAPIALERRGGSIGLAIACVALGLAALSIFGWLAR